MARQFLLIAASGESGNQIGVAPESKILPVKVLDESGNGSTDATTKKGIRWAVTHGARIINISTTGGPSSDLRSAVNDAISKKTSSLLRALEIDHSKP